MKQRVVLFLCFLISLSAWILVISRRPESRVQSHTSTTQETSDKEVEKMYLPIIPGRLNKAQLLLMEITRLKIKLEFLHYNFTFSGVHKLEDLLMDHGGTPVRSLIVSTWRSGSGFLGDLLNVMSSTFYHYEPLMKFGVTQIHGPPYGNASTQYLKQLFQCDHRAIESFIHYWKSNLHTKMFRNFNPIQNNRRLWSMCGITDQLCFNSYLISLICRMFPFQSMKLVRFRLKLVKDLLADKQLNIKAVLLIRDPRGVMEARRRFVQFCPNPICVNPELLCNDMVSDYVAAQQLSKKYPNRFMVVRYEELMLNTNVTGLQLIKFFRLGPSLSFPEYLKTNGNVGLEVSKYSVFRWQTMDFDSIAKIQVQCKEAMELWDYDLAHNASHMKSYNFYPLQTHSVFPLPMQDDDFDGAFNM